MVPALPIEILQHIIRLAAPNLEVHVRKRYRFLSRCCLVSHAWRALAQRELYRYVHLRTLMRAQCFKTRIPHLPTLQQYARCTKSLTVALGTAASSQLISDILILLPGLQNVTITRATVDSAMLSWAAELRTLYLSCVVFKFPSNFQSEAPFIWYLPALTILHLTDLRTGVEVEGSSTFTPNLISMDILSRARSFPSLTCLSFTWHNGKLPPVLSHIGPQLHSLLLRRTLAEAPDEDADEEDPFPQFPDGTFKSLTNLKHLAIDLKYANDIQALAEVPSTLETLRLDGRRRVVDAQLAATEFKCCRNLKELHLRSTSSSNSDWKLATEARFRTRGTEVREFTFQPNDTDKATRLWMEAIEDYNTRWNDSA